MDDTSAALPVPADKLCLFEVSPGVKCNDPNHFGRGYCQRHYRQLSRAGAFNADKRKPTDHAVVLANVAAVRRARRKLLKSAPDIVDAFVAGMKNQAQNGKTDAAQWAILHTHIVAPVGVPKENDTGKSGVVVNVGVKVSGTPTE